MSIRLHEALCQVSGYGSDSNYQDGKSIQWGSRSYGYGFAPNEDGFFPLDRRPCAWYSLKLEEEKQDGEGGISWINKGTFSSDKMVTVEDNSGRCAVDLNRAEINMDSAMVSYPIFRGDKRLELFNSMRVRCRVTYLDVGDTVYARGPVLFLSDRDSILRARSDEKLYVYDKSESQLLNDYHSKIRSLGYQISYLLRLASMRTWLCDRNYGLFLRAPLVAETTTVRTGSPLQKSHVEVNIFFDQMENE